MGNFAHPRVFKHLCASDLAPDGPTLSSGIFLHKHKTPRAQIMYFITEVSFNEFGRQKQSDQGYFAVFYGGG